MRRFYKRTPLHKISSNFSRGIVSLLLIKKIVGITFVAAFLFGAIAVSITIVIVHFAMRLYL